MRISVNKLNDDDDDDDDDDEAVLYSGKCDGHWRTQFTNWR